MTRSSSTEAAAQALWQARTACAPIEPLRDFFAGDALEAASAVQALNHRRAAAEGARRIGRKIGLTSRAVQRQFGVDQPAFGALFDDMVYSGPSTVVPLATLMQPRIEGEIAFIVAEDITEAGLDREALRRRAGDAVAAFEIVDSAIRGWRITLADTVADNASCGALVLGQQRRRLADFEPKAVQMVMTEDGTPVSTGTGAASLDDPLAAFAWLADTCVALGDPLRAGEVVLTGALGPMVPFVRGRQYRLAVTGFEALEVIAE